MTFVPPSSQEIELEAAWIVATILRGRPKKRDVVGGAPMTHDFDIITSTGSKICLEVTASVIGEVAAFWRELAERPVQGQGLTWDWSINVAQPQEGLGGVRVSRLRKELVPLLTILEDIMPDGVTDALTDLAGVSNRSDLAIQGLRNLRVQTANPLRKVNDGIAQVAIGTGGFYRSPQLADLIESAGKDNAEKLSLAEGDERHLFIWITNSDIGNSAWLALDLSPTVQPNIAPIISTVWIALWSPNYNAEVQAMQLWSWSADRGWFKHVIPAVRSYASGISSNP